MSLYKKLEEYSKSDYIPMHMPGHKRRIEGFGMENAARIDITEIDGFDDYHYPEGIIREIEEQASRIYRTEHSYYLVNGSTVGLLSAISAVTAEKDPIIVARNCHKSVYNGVFVNGLMPHYIYPEVDKYGILCGIRPKTVEEALAKTKAKAVVITSPTYEGVVSDIERIADICHKMNAVLIVDEAHGAHFNYQEYFPKTAMDCGADLVIESLHKTLPSYTQTAIIHQCSNRVEEHLLRKYLSIYQTSSPSYVFMAGINRCIDYMVSEEGRKQNIQYIENLKNLREKLKTLKNISLWEPCIREGKSSDYGKEDERNMDSGAFDYDPSKIVLYCRGGGMQIYRELLEKYHIQMEMGAADYVIAMTSIGDEAEWYDRFYTALCDIDVMLGGQSEPEPERNRNAQKALSYTGRTREGVKGTQVMVCKSPKEALDQEKNAKSFEWEDAVGRVTLEWIYAYPPGIPLMYPGELVTAELVEEMCYMKEHGVSLKGFRDSKGEKIVCIE
ncbi:MAG: aminotransferase class I/II-fold pyridoxal phosphate-dependent enzyme [Lachnospiraceae bacterium]